jgi:L-alanine-DL-glutamate epimerase-like enolase superfamily enzyme
MPSVDAAITVIEMQANTVPTDVPEADETFAWDRTTMILVEMTAGDRTGFGYTYSSSAAAQRGAWSGVSPSGRSRESDALGCDGPRLSQSRLERPDATAFCAVDVALCDLKARLLDMALARLLGPERTEVPIRVIRRAALSRISLWDPRRGLPFLAVLIKPLGTSGRTSILR